MCPSLWEYHSFKRCIGIHYIKHYISYIKYFFNNGQYQRIKALYQINFFFFWTNFKQCTGNNVWPIISCQVLFANKVRSCHHVIRSFSSFVSIQKHVFVFCCLCKRTYFTGQCFGLPTQIGKIFDIQGN